MTIVPKPAQEELIQQAIDAGLIASPEELIDVALEALPHKEAADSARQAAVKRMLAFGQKYNLSLGEPVTRQMLHEGHRT
jgi:hypothetical protein